MLLVSTFFQDRAMKVENRLSSTTTLTVNVMDSDDQDPAFEHDTYNAKVSRGIKFKMSENNTKVTLSTTMENYGALVNHF
jgi:hypothetical protein